MKQILKKLLNITDFNITNEEIDAKCNHLYNKYLFLEWKETMKEENIIQDISTFLERDNFSKKLFTYFGKKEMKDDFNWDNPLQNNFYSQMFVKFFRSKIRHFVRKISFLKTNV